MDLIRELFAVILVLGILLALVWLSRARTLPFAVPLPWKIKSNVCIEGQVALLSRMSLTPTTSLHLVRAHARTFLLAVHGAGVTVLSEWNAPEESGK